ncbi:MAG: tetratricopeptide repeat protein [Rhodanobacteraceae bacterium]
MADLFARLKQRKIVQWAVAYVAAAWVVLQVLDLASGSYGWPKAVMHIAFGVLAVGFVVTLVLAWYHGERGEQRVRGMELLIVALILAVGGGLLWHFGKAGSSPAVAMRSLDGAQRYPGDSAQRIPGNAAPGSVAFAPKSPDTAAEAAASGLHAAQPIPAKSIAVLPFENLSGDPKQAYFSDGITVEILNALAQIPDLKVAGRTSAFHFSSRDANLHQIGTMLGVANVLEGSVQKAGDEVRITVQLVDTRTGYQLWSEKYDRKLTNIFAIEDGISSAVAGNLRVQLTGAAGQALVVQHAIDPRAHDFYLRGLVLLAARGSGLRDAVAAFQNAVKIDPVYAQAWGAMAEAQALYPDYHLGTMPVAYASALADAQHALSLNPDLASVHVAQGMLYEHQWRWSEADGAFRRALALAPNDGEAVNQYAQFLAAIGQLRPALAEIERAQQLDPLSPVIATVHGQILLTMHRDQAASAQINRALAINPKFRLAHAFAAFIDQHAGRLPQALVHARMAGLPHFAMLLRGMADPALRGKVLRELETSPSFAKLRGSTFMYARFLMALGARDRALDVLETIAADRATQQPHVIWSPAFDPIRNDPRFKALLKKMGLPYTPKDAATP